MTLSPLAGPPSPRTMPVDVARLEREHGERILIRQARKGWHGVKVGRPDWGEDSHSLAFSAELAQEGLAVYMILNAYWEPLDFELAAAADYGAPCWRRWIDTSLESPDDIVAWEIARDVSGPSYRAAPRSVVVLFGERAAAGTR